MPPSVTGCPTRSSTVTVACIGSPTGSTTWHSARPAPSGSGNPSHASVPLLMSLVRRHGKVNMPEPSVVCPKNDPHLDRVYVPSMPRARDTDR
ncbi:hypothetical protein GCM10018966_005880 [Streptomyces yanii]